MTAEGFCWRFISKWEEENLASSLFELSQQQSSADIWCLVFDPADPMERTLLSKTSNHVIEYWIRSSCLCTFPSHDVNCKVLFILNEMKKILVKEYIV
jgi:hypothetical protein